MERSRLKLAAAIISAVVLMNPAPALAEWVFVDDTRRGYVEIETDSIQEDGNRVHYWERQVYEVPERDGTKLRATYVAMDCQRGIKTLLEFVSFNRNGQLLSHIKGRPEQLSSMKVEPGTNGAVIYNFVCR